MQLTSVFAILAASAAVSATPLEARQGIPRVRATFYNNGGFCGPPEQWREDTVFTQEQPYGVCHNFPVGPFQSTYFNESSITRTFRFYSVPCGNEENTGNHFDITPAQNPTPGCITQAIRSYKVL